MKWIAPSEKEDATPSLEKKLRDSADQFRANSGLKAQAYSGPILGIIFVRFAEVRFAQQRARLEKASASSRRGSRVDETAAYHADGILYLSPNARFDFLQFYTPSSIVRLLTEVIEPYHGRIILGKTLLRLAHLN